MSVGNANLYIQKYLGKAADILQKRTFLYEGIFPQMTTGQWDTASIEFNKPKNVHQEFSNPAQKLSGGTYEYERRLVGKRSYFGEMDLYAHQMQRENDMISILTDQTTNVANSLARLKNSIVAEAVFGVSTTQSNNATQTNIAWPTTDATYVVPANPTAYAIHGAPANTFKMHLDKILRAFELLSAQGYDPQYNSEQLYAIMSLQDYHNLKASKDSANNLILSDKDFDSQSYEIKTDSGEVLQKTLVRFNNMLTIIIDDGFFNSYNNATPGQNNGAAINRKTTGIGSTTLTDGRSIPLFIADSYRWYDEVVTPLELRKRPEFVNAMSLIESRMSSLTRVQEKGIVEIEVATNVT